MNSFPQFMRNPANAIDAQSQSRGIAGYVFDGVDGSQMAFWECREDGQSAEHVHPYDEYMLVVQGTYTLDIEGRQVPVTAGKEYFIPRDVAHGGRFTAGTRTIHAFGGKRATRVGESG